MFRGGYLIPPPGGEHGKLNKNTILLRGKLMISLIKGGGDILLTRSIEIKYYRTHVGI